MQIKVVAVKQRYKLKSNSQQACLVHLFQIVVAVKQRYKLKSNSQLMSTLRESYVCCCCKAKIQT